MKKAESQVHNIPTADEAASAPPSAVDPEAVSEEVVTDELPVAVELGTLSPEQFDELKTRAAKADEHWDRLLRTTADFENFKKRAARERQDATRFANESLIQKLITVLDNFEMAQAAAQAGGAGSLKSLQEGIAMIYQQLRNTLTEAGLEEIDASGKPFDPNLHEAVSQQESAEVPEGQVLQQLRKGYKLRERLLRPATVVVAKQPAVD
jgi:molecular chaperone GrpE